jgi:hypothetical protein
MASPTAPRSAGATVAVSLCLLAGLALIWLAAPRTVAYAVLARGNDVLADLSRGATPAPDRLLTAIASRRAALGWIDLPDTVIDMGGLYLAMARTGGLSRGDRNALLDRSIRSFERGLAAAPSRPFAWAQLAQARQLQDPASRAVDPLLRMSIRTGPREPRLISQRVRIGFAARGNLSPETAETIVGDIRRWARYDPWRLADWARPQFALPWVRRALADRPALEREFLVNYLRLPPR